MTETETELLARMYIEEVMEGENIQQKLGQDLVLLYSVNWRSVVEKILGDENDEQSQIDQYKLKNALILAISANLEGLFTFFTDVEAGVFAAEEPELTEEVLKAIIGYALNSDGIKMVLTREVKARGLTTAEEITNLIGWPLNEHTEEKASAIWDRFKPLS